MTIKLKQFGSTTNQSLNSVDFLTGKEIPQKPVNADASAIDPRLAAIQSIGTSANSYIGRSPDPSAVQTLPDGSRVSATNLSPAEQKIYEAVAQANKFSEKITGPLNKFYSTANDIGNSIDAVKGILGERGSIQRALNQAGNLVGLDIFSLKKKNTKKNAENVNSTAVSPPNYPYPRIAWEITTQWRILMGLPPTRFYVNPNTITYNQNLLETIEMVQKGNIITNWKDINVKQGNRFPKMDVTFKFQSSNILPESYAKTKINFSNKGNLLDTIKNLFGANAEKTSADIDQPYGIPPGLVNFFDILSIFHEERTISKLNLYNIPNSLNNKTKGTFTDLSQINKNNVNPDIENFAGTPNYVYLSISTRIYPKMTMKGFLIRGYSLSESAQSPLSFETDLNFTAFETDPAWWDTEKIRKAYTNFYTQYQKDPSKIKDIQPSINENKNFNKIPEGTYAKAAVAKAAADKAAAAATAAAAADQLTQLNQQSNTAAFANLNLNKPFDADELGRSTSNIIGGISGGGS